MSETTSDPTDLPESPDAIVEEAADLVADLEAARADLADVEDRIDEIGEQRVEAVANAHDRAIALLDRYVDAATGTGDFESYVTFQGEFADLVEGLPEDLPERDAFEEANETVDQRRLSESDFEQAREALEPAGELAALLDEREAARSDLRDVRRTVERRRAALDDHVDELERLQRLGEADLDAPVEEIREPVNRYDEAVTEAFREFRREAGAREVLSFVAATAAYPLVDFADPPADLREYVESHPVGDEPIPTLLEYADYSRSKLDHYVEDVGAFRSAVPMHRTYLDRLDAEPLTVGWPPPTAERLRYVAEELVRVVARFADEDVVALAREVRTLADREDYDRLRDAAVARAELSEAERERVERGDVEDELAAVREARDRLRDAMDAN